MVDQEIFDKAVMELGDFLKELQEKYGLTDREVLDITEIAGYDYH